MMAALTVSPFRQRIYDLLQLVPSGRVTTYRLLGNAAGCRSPRAVGQAMRYNPFAPDVPCHRVIKSDLSLGGFGGVTTGAPIEKKRALLKSEGVLFVSGKLADPSRLFTFGLASRGSACTTRSCT